MVDIAWVAGLLLVTVAATAGRHAATAEEGSPEPLGWAPILLPYAPLLLAGVVVASQPLTIVFTGPVEVVAALLVVAVMVRQVMAVRENRRLLSAVVEQALHDPHRPGQPGPVQSAPGRRDGGAGARHGTAIGVIALDLNDFKMVNDTLGHPVGDALLIDVADRLVNSVRPGDTVARVGGDEFSVLVESSADAAHLIAYRLAEAFDSPFLLNGQELSMPPSFGLAIAEHDEPDMTADELLRRADTAMYAAKRARLRGVQTYSPEMNLLPGVTDAELAGRAAVSPAAGGVAAIELLGDLRQAIADGELTLVYQPKIDLTTERVVGWRPCCAGRARTAGCSRRSSSCRWSAAMG